MKAIVHVGEEGLNGVSYIEMEEKPVPRGSVKVKLKTAGLNRRDLGILKRHKETDPPLIIGSDGAGIIEAIGEDVSNVNIGDEVVINPGLRWFEKSDAPPDNFEILGLPDHGTFAESIIISAEQVEPKPEYLTWEEAGVLPLAALTAYRALFTRGKLRQEDTVLIPGIGSGVATYILQYAKQIGATVIVTSRSEEKRKKALALGADFAIDTNSDWDEALNGKKVDLVIESIGKATFTKSIKQIRKGGTVVTFGATTEDDVSINIRDFFYGQYNLLGTTMGSRDEFREMLSFVTEHNIRPVVDRVYPLEQTKDALQYMQESKNFGKIGIVM